MCPITTPKALDAVSKLLKTAKRQHSITLTRLGKLEESLEKDKGAHDGDPGS